MLPDIVPRHTCTASPSHHLKESLPCVPDTSQFDSVFSSQRTRWVPSKNLTLDYNFRRLHSFHVSQTISERHPSLFPSSFPLLSISLRHRDTIIPLSVPSIHISTDCALATTLFYGSPVLRLTRLSISWALTPYSMHPLVTSRHQPS